MYRAYQQAGDEEKAMLLRNVFQTLKVNGTNDRNDYWSRKSAYQLEQPKLEWLLNPPRCEQLGTQQT